MPVRARFFPSTSVISHVVSCGGGKNDVRGLAQDLKRLVKWHVGFV